ncbi:hypothetical protein JJ691_13980 [Kutzneria sp. CA-103260]|nr:hypothetical protein JJ691_13980 [Kutzneria sp. CA-103260]
MRRSPELDELLARADKGETVTGEILDLLTADPALWEEFQRRAPLNWQFRGPTGAYLDLPGDGEPSAEIVYRCTDCEYKEVLYEVGEPVPTRCPQCNSAEFRRA